MKLKPSLLAFAAMAAFLGQAHAVVLFGTTVGGPTWNRPLAGTPPAGLSGVGTATPYSVIQFAVETSGTYTFLDTATSPANWDNFTFLYINSFSAAAPLTNVRIGNDDFPTIGLSGFNFALTANTNYFFVTTGFANTDSGTYRLSITQAVPEPATYALMALGMVGFALTRLRRTT